MFVHSGNKYSWRTSHEAFRQKYVKFFFSLVAIRFANVSIRFKRRWSQEEHADYEVDASNFHRLKIQ